MSDIVHENLFLLEKELKKLLVFNTNFLILCLGNELMGDDALGIIIGQELKNKLPLISNKIVIAHNVPVNFIGKIAKISPSTILIVDAINTDLKPGLIALFSPKSIINTSSTSTHYQELDDLISFLKLEGMKLPIVKILGIQIKALHMQNSLSDVVKSSVNKLVKIFINIFD